MSDEIIEARSRETFVSSVQGRPDSGRSGRNASKTPFKERFWSFNKKHAPLIVIVGLLITAVSLLFVSQSFLPFALVDRFIEEYNGTGIASTLRSDSVLDFQLSSAGTRFALSETQRSAFKDHNIYPVDFTFDGSLNTALVFRNASGGYEAVVPKSVAGSSSAMNANSAIAQNLNNSAISLSSAPVAAEDALKRTDFSDQYTTASKTWRGGNAGWYDSMEDLTDARLAVTRSRYASWASAAVSGVDAAWRRLASGRSSVSDNGILEYGTVSTTDADGNPTTATTSGSVDASSAAGQTSESTIRDVLNSKISTAAKLATTVGCAGVEIINTIRTYMSAQQTLQYLNLATGFLEATSRVKSGQTDGTPMNKYVEALTATDPETGETAMQGPTMIEEFSGGTVDVNDDSIKTTNFDALTASLGTLTSNLDFTAKAFEYCSYAKLAVSSANLASTVLEFVPVLGQAVSAVHVVTKVVTRLALGVTIGTITAFIVPKIITAVVKNIAQNVATEWVGPELGNALVSGGHRYISSNFQTSGGAAMSKDALLAYNQTKTTVLAASADYDRRNKSAFDLSSRYTFLGSLAYSLIPLATSSTLGGVVKSVGSLVAGSVSSLLPSASAVAQTSLATSLGICPQAENSDAACDANGVIYRGQDTSTLSLNYAEIEAKILEIDPNAFKGETETGQKIVNPDSNLGKTLSIINTRIVDPGVPDGTAVSRLVSTPSTLIANIPLVGDVASITSAFSEISNHPWIYGDIGVMSANNPYWDTEIKYYEQYAFDQREQEVSGIIAKSSVTSLLEEYYENNPLDNSREGILARYSGLTKDEVIAVEDTLEVMTYLANYDPASRTDFSQNHVAYAINYSCQNRSCETPNSPHWVRLETPETTEPLNKLVVMNTSISAMAPSKNAILLSAPSLAQGQNLRTRRESSKVAA